MCSIPKHNVTHCTHPDSSWVTASIHPFLRMQPHTRESGWFSATEKPHQEFLWILSTFKPWKYFFQGCHPGIVSFSQQKLFILASAAVMCDWGTKFLSVSTHILRKIISCPTAIQDVWVCVRFREQKVVQCVLSVRRKMSICCSGGSRCSSNVPFRAARTVHVGLIDCLCDSDNPKHQQHNECYSATGLLLCSHFW